MEEASPRAAPTPLLVTAGGNAQEIAAFDAGNGELVRSMKGTGFTVWNVAFKSLVASECRGHEAEVRAGAPSADGKYLVSGSLDQSARIQDLESGALLASFRDGGLEVPFTLSLLSGTNEIGAVAVNPDGVEPSMATLQVNFNGAKAEAKFLLLAVGINTYKNPRFNLNFCRPDVDAFADAVVRRAGALFSDINVEKLNDEEATSDATMERLEKIAENAFAGHGVVSDGEDGTDSEFYIVPDEVITNVWQR